MNHARVWWLWEHLCSSSVALQFDYVFADIYMAQVKSDRAGRQGDLNRTSPTDENGFFGNSSAFANHQLPREESMSYSPAMESSRIVNAKMDGSKSSTGSVSALTELVRWRVCPSFWFLNFLSLPQDYEIRFCGSIFPTFTPVHDGGSQFRFSTSASAFSQSYDGGRGSCTGFCYYLINSSESLISFGARNT